ILTKRLEKLDIGELSFNPKLEINHMESAKTILEELTDRMIFETSAEMKEELNQLMKYDFDPKTANAQKRILKVYQYLAKSPEFQII
ncbi:MAG TPA: hypothetical protein PLH86_03165, partial [Saprospiraceae bacterium]|nr:hypothetical protein [Saprospiraceae bacterium]